MKEKNSLFSIYGDDLIQYDSENDWAGNYFFTFPNASVLNYAGIYAFTLCGEIVYVGSSIKPLNRLRTHIISIQHGDNCHSLSVAERKYYYLNKHISNVEFHIMKAYDKHIAKHQLESYEYEYMNHYCPIFNVNYGGNIIKWCGTDQDIDDFVDGKVSINTLKDKLINSTK